MGDDEIHDIIRKNPGKSCAEIYREIKLKYKFLKNENQYLAFEYDSLRKTQSLLKVERYLLTDEIERLTTVNDQNNPPF